VGALKKLSNGRKATKPRGEDRQKLQKNSKNTETDRKKKYSKTPKQKPE
jgi:hypothetical protein